MLVLRLERGPDDPCRCVVDEHVDRAQLRDLGGDLLGGDVPSQEDGFGSERLELPSGLLGGAVGAEVPDDDAGCAFTRQTERDRLADAPRAAGDEDGAAGRGLAQEGAGGSGAEAGAEDGNRLPADPCARLEGQSRPPSTMPDRGHRGERASSSAYGTHRVVLRPARRSPRARAPRSGKRSAALPARNEGVDVVGGRRDHRAKTLAPLLRSQVLRIATMARPTPPRTQGIARR